METIEVIRCGRSGNWATAGRIFRHADLIVVVVSARVVELSFSRLRHGEHCPEQHCCPWLLEIQARPATPEEEAAYLAEQAEIRERREQYEAKIAARRAAYMAAKAAK